VQLPLPQKLICLPDAIGPGVVLSASAACLELQFVKPLLAI